MTHIRGWDKGQFETPNGISGWYWSSSATQTPTIQHLALNLRIQPHYAAMWFCNKYWAMAIRPVKE